MAKYSTWRAFLQACADAIRYAKGSSAGIIAEDIPDEIATISGGGASGVVYITDELDEHGGIVRHLTTDGATITDTTDAHGGIVRSITGAEVRLQVKRVTPSSTQQTITADSGYGALGKVIVEAANEMMIVEITNGTADHTFAEIFNAVNGGTPVFLRIPANGGDDWAEEYTNSAYLMPVVRAYKYDNLYRVVAAAAHYDPLPYDASYGYVFAPAMYTMQASDIDDYPTFLRYVYPTASSVSSN